MRMDDVKYGQRVSCNGVNGTVIDKRRTRNKSLVLVKMDNGYTLKLDADTLSVGSPETARTSGSPETSRTSPQMTHVL
jgi:hypothetical protein